MTPHPFFRPAGLRARALVCLLASGLAFGAFSSARADGGVSGADGVALAHGLSGPAPMMAAPVSYGAAADQGYYTGRTDGRPGGSLLERMSGLGAESAQDGAYGPSVIDVGGMGPASQNAVLYVSKSAVVRLPMAAREVVVSDPAIVSAALRTSRQIMLGGLKVGQTNVFAFDEKGAQILNLEIRVESDVRGVESMLRSAFPNANLRVEAMLGQLIISGDAASLREAQDIRVFARRAMQALGAAAGKEISFDDAQIVDRLNVAGENQVALKVRVAEMRREVVKQFGVNLSASGVLGSTSTISVSNPFSVNGVVGGGLSGALRGALGDASIASLVRAFERHGAIRLLAEPTLTAVSGEKASFLAGGQFPYPVSVDDNGNIGYDFRNFGVALEFTPVVLDGGRISLKIATEVSELTNEGALSTGVITIPGISIRRASTTVEAPSGGALVMAGLIQQRDAADHAGLPGLKSLPILGQLFSSTDFKRSETELVIIVTPYLVRPGAPADFRLPTDGYAAPSDSDLYLMGRLHAIYGSGAHDLQAARKALRAPLGFIFN